MTYYGYGGDDYFDAYGTGVSVYAYGHGGNDTLIGSHYRDELWGGAGNDTLYGGYDPINNPWDFDGSWDYLDGRSGADYLNGEKDGIADTLIGGSGFDTFERDMVFTGSWRSSSRRNIDADIDFNVAEYDSYVGF